MGESNAIMGRKTSVSRDVLLAAEAIYKELHGVEEGIPATFQVVFMVRSRSPDSLTSDRMDTGTEPAQAAREGIGYDQLEGRSIDMMCIRYESTRTTSDRRAVIRYARAACSILVQSRQCNDDP
jgi:hypothetical protein